MSQQESPSSSPANSPPPVAIPAVPRPVTSKAARRAWLEPQVRFWWIVAILLLVSAAAMLPIRIKEWAEENGAITSNVVVEASGFDAVDPIAVRNRPLPVGSPVRLDYEYNGQTYQAVGTLVPTTRPFLSGNKFPIHINPDKPTVWSVRSDPASLIEKTIGPLLMLISGVTSSLIALFARWQALRTWMHGDAVAGRVIEHGTRPLAPRSVALRCVLDKTGEQRMLTVYLPQDSDLPAPGKPVALIQRGATVLAVANYL